MKRTVLLGLTLIAMIIVIVIVARRESPRAGEGVEYEGNFAIADINEIGKIVLTHRAGPTFTLARGQTGWTVDGRYPVRMSSLNPLLDAMKLVQIRYIPGDAAIANVMENIEGTYIHVDVVGRNGEMLKSYRIGGVTPDERGTYMVMDGSSQPFVVHIPAWDGALRARYTLLLDDWRDRKFMQLSADDIVEVKVNYPRQRSQSFHLKKELTGYALSPLYPELRDYPKTYRNGTGEAFLKALADAACEGYENAFPLKDSIHSLVPFCEMQIRLSKDREEVHVRVWPKGVPVYTQYSPPVHRLFIEREPGDFVLAQFEVVKGILRGYDFFTGTETELIF